MADIVIEGDTENPPVLGAEPKPREQIKGDAYDGLAQSDHE